MLPGCRNFPVAGVWVLAARYYCAQAQNSPSQLSNKCAQSCQTPLATARARSSGTTRNSRFPTTITAKNHLEPRVPGNQSESESSSDDDGNNGVIFEQSHISEALGYEELNNVKAKMDEVYAWLKGLSFDPSQTQICIDRQSVRHHKRVVKDMKESLEDVAEKATKYVDLACRAF